MLRTVVNDEVTGFPGIPTVFAMTAGMRNLEDFAPSRIRCVTNTAAASPVKDILVPPELFPKARI